MARFFNPVQPIGESRKEEMVWPATKLGQGVEGDRMKFVALDALAMMVTVPHHIVEWYFRVSI